MALMLLYIEKVTIWSGVTDARQLTHWQTLKDRATQPLISRSGRNDPIYRRKPPNWKWQTIPRTFLDSVLVPPIGEGVGLSETLLFLDGNHSQVGTGGYMAIRLLWISTPHWNKPNFMFLQVSVLTKIVPSPDWFIGLSSVELCNDGAFVKSHTEEVMNF